MGQIKLGEAGTIDCFNLAFQYQIKKIIERMDKNNHKLKILCKCMKVKNSAIWQHMLQISPTKVLIS